MKKPDNEDLNFSELTKKQKEILLEWAKKVKGIQKNDQLSFKEKITELKTLNNSGAFKSSTKIITAYVKRYWRNANWTERLALLGAGGTLIVFGSGGAGISALGGAIGLPLFLVTAAGGALIGIIIDKLESK